MAHCCTLRFTIRASFKVNGKSLSLHQLKIDISTLSLSLSLSLSLFLPSSLPLSLSFCKSIFVCLTFLVVVVLRNSSIIGSITMLEMDILRQQITLDKTGNCQGKYQTKNNIFLNSLISFMPQSIIRTQFLFHLNITIEKNVAKIEC